MGYFKETEPWLLAEQLAAKNDRWAASYPRCECCGRPITDSMLVYIPDHDEHYCLDCIEAMTEFNEAAEVE